jgi:type I restriction enzyme, S subunit
MVQEGLSLAKVREIPVPRLSDCIQEKVVEHVAEALRLIRAARSSQERAERLLLYALGLADWTPPEPLAYSAKSADVFAAARFDAQYFMPAKRTIRDALARVPGQTIGERFLSARDMLDPNDAPSDTTIRNYDVTDALQPILDDETEPVATKTIGSIKKMFKDGDVAISRLRAYLREIAVVRTSGTVPAVGSSEFIVLRPRDPKSNAIAPETLLTFLRCAVVQTILKWCQDGSQHPRFSEGDPLSIPIPERRCRCFSSDRGNREAGLRIPPTRPRLAELRQAYHRNRHRRQRSRRASFSR